MYNIYIYIHVYIYIVIYIYIHPEHGHFMAYGDSRPGQQLSFLLLKAIF